MNPGKKKQNNPEQADLLSDSKARGDGLIYDGRLRQKAIEFSLVDGRALIEGDIDVGEPKTLNKDLESIKSENTKRQNSAVVSDNKRLWDEGVVYFVSPENIEWMKTLVDAAIREIEAKTVLVFKKRKTEENYIVFEAANYASSPVGRRGGKQTIRLSEFSSTGNAVHELCHSIGLWHEQSRADRDSYVQVLWENIVPGYEHNFRQRISDGDDIGQYDYNSIMHYPEDAFSSNDRPTIVPLTGSRVIGQRRALSDLDILSINALYSSGNIREVPAVNSGVDSAVKSVPDILPGRQFVTKIDAYGTARVMTNGWPREKIIHWSIIPSQTSVKAMEPQINWKIAVSNETENSLAYFFTINNLTSNTLEVEAWYALSDFSIN